MQPPIQDRLEEFYRLAYERQSIWHKKASGLGAPWTDNPVFSEWRFTNVFRELDHGTVRLVKALEDADYSGCSESAVVFNVWLYRMLNLVDSWEAVTGGQFIGMLEPDLNLLIEKLEARQTGGQPLFTSSHTTSSLKVMLEAMPTVVKVASPLAKRFESFQDLRDVYEHIRCLPGVGNFISYQIAQDLTYGPVPVVTASVSEWAPASPGVLGGLEALFGRRITPSEAVHCMNQIKDLQDETFDKLGLDFQLVAHPDHTRMSLSATEHWTCEYMKYHRIAYEGGVGRTRYSPRLLS